ncbi:M61 family metallopeptidase [Novosphingobium sp. JCM 18896]|uniref:M61 family metallopeptidase n=1 Tax=Novosphingobium sp. JCM 18896 TaxID=2989731 RepID=UPI002223B417|nr:peptidase M61 [Novosphingobium sp. JCM 18896]MCW1431557.1 peptidase M61 [Novosphingobium sp. JCM 18896]
MRSLIPAAALLAALPVAFSANAQTLPSSQALNSPPMAQPIVRAVPDPQDVAWPGGTIRLDIDASDTQRGAYRVTETIPLAAGTRKIALLLPQWLPGNHGPRGPLAELADLRFTVDGKPVVWRRDPVEVYAFHVDLPEGARELVAKFAHTSPLQTSEGRITVTQEMLNLQWEKMSLYPAGHYVRRIRIKPSVVLPKGWTAATALDGQSVSGDTVRWAETDYESLVDSPIFAGTHFRKWDLGHKVTLNVVADEPELLAVAPSNLAKLTAMVDETLATFGRPAFDRYEFLLALTDRMGGIGLEHLRSSENQMEPRNFIDWEGMDWDRNVLPHEFAHSWNGKYRRPARLWTPDYRQPMQDDLLWVYEGQTQFWGLIHAARSGVQTREMVLGMLASQAGNYAEQPGRAWRSVEDTTFDPVFAARKPKPYGTLARSEDYYNEGALIWLEADQIIRAGTGGRKGLDDFAKAFFSYKGDGPSATYEFADVVATLDSVYRYDWAGFLRTRIQGTGQPAPLAGIEKGGYRLVWRDEPNAYDKARMDDAKSLSLTYSLGVSLDREGTVTATQWNGPAFNAGLVTGAKIVAVNGRTYDHDKIKQAITAAKTGAKPIELLVKRGDRFLTVSVPYKGGLRWPWLERASTRGTAPLDSLMAPRRGTPEK